MKEDFLILVLFEHMQKVFKHFLDTFYKYIIAGIVRNFIGRLQIFIHLIFSIQIRKSM